MVTEKGDQTRVVFFTARTARALADWLGARSRDAGPWVFVSLRDPSKALSARGISHMLRRRGKQAGVKGPVNPHAFRHFFAISWLMAGGDLATLSNILGHSDVSVTVEYYARFNVRELQQKHDLHSPIAGLEGGEDGES